MQNFEARKRLLDYDDVMNQQREVIYDLRSFALEGGEDLKGEAWDMIEKTLDRLSTSTRPRAPTRGVGAARAPQPPAARLLPHGGPAAGRGGRAHDFGRATSSASTWSSWPAPSSTRSSRQFGSTRESLLRYIVLSTIDERWKDHLYDLDHLKASIGFRGWGQKDPLIEYKRRRTTCSWTC
jgi:preprotein translocase subunit SecA